VADGRTAWVRRCVRVQPIPRGTTSTGRTTSASARGALAGARVIVLLVLASMVAGASMGCAGEEPRVAKDGDSVKVHYHGTFDDGEVFDSSRDGEPLPFTVGTGQVIDGFDNAVKGLGVGDSVKVHLEPAQAYGEHSDEMVLQVPADQAPQGLSAGDQVRLQNGQTAVVQEVTPEFVRIDANHPLAGRALNFEIELVAID
jgi:FKBP-type peptidyl-prolyl cis-trans isomerase 2